MQKNLGFRKYEVWNWQSLTVPLSEALFSWVLFFVFCFCFFVFVCFLFLFLFFCFCFCFCFVVVVFFCFCIFVNCIQTRFNSFMHTDPDGKLKHQYGNLRTSVGIFGICLALFIHSNFIQTLLQYQYTNSKTKHRNNKNLYIKNNKWYSGDDLKTKKAQRGPPWSNTGNNVHKSNKRKTKAYTTKTCQKLTNSIINVFGLSYSHFWTCWKIHIYRFS